ncbi:MAG TPA: hypothetical protein VGO36_03420 [Solirubrobacterales bacterium]|jgi:hypothetical protein|nr:hypothetical protein [Solirubrobacterales bacterium]
MFDSKKNLSWRLTDAVDLLIDFATLGEYGLEPVGRTTPSCETRHRRTAPSGTSRRRRAGEPAPIPGAPIRLRLSAPTPRPIASTRRHRIDGPFLLRP